MTTEQLDRYAQELDSLETAHGFLERRVQQRLHQISDELQQLRPTTDCPSWLLQRIRCDLMMGHDQHALGDLERLLAMRPGSEIVEQALHVLRTLDDPRTTQSIPEQPEALADQVRLQQVMEQLPILLECPDLEILRIRTCELARRLLRCQEVTWLEGEAWPEQFSSTLLSQALREQRPVVGQPSTSESLLLSEVQSALAVPIDANVLLYAVHRTLEQLWGPDDLAVASMLAEIVGLRLSLLLERQQEEAHTRELWNLRSRLQEVVDVSEVGLIWLNEQGEPVSSNRWADLWLPAEGVPLDDLPNVWRLRGRDGTLRWIEARRENELIILRDLSHQRLEDLLLVLEQDRQQMAADLHDGPLQMVIVHLQQKQDAASHYLLGEMNDTLNWLRSPLLEGSSLHEALAEAALSQLPQTKVLLSGLSPSAASVHQMALYRCAFETFQYLGEHLYQDELQIRLLENVGQLSLFIEPVTLADPPLLHCSAARLFEGRLQPIGAAWELRLSWVVEAQA